MPLPLRVPLHMSGRAKPHSQVYFGMCAKSLMQYRSLDNRLQAMDAMSAEYNLAYAAAHEASIKPVVFGAMCVEASLYDLSAALFGQTYADEVDRIPPPARFKRIAIDVDKVEPDPDLPIVKALTNLFLARKKLVHYKSKPMPEQDWGTTLSEFQNDHAIHLLGIESSFRAPVLLSIFFDGNIFEDLRILPSFKLPEYWKSAIPVDLHDEVQSCIAESARSRGDALYLTTHGHAGRGAA